MMRRQICSSSRFGHAPGAVFFLLASTVAFVWLFVSGAVAQGGGELRFCLRSEPKTFDPLKVEDDASESIRQTTERTRCAQEW